jgi:hypothetical protein
MFSHHPELNPSSLSRLIQAYLKKGVRLYMTTFPKQGKSGNTLISQTAYLIWLADQPRQ